MSDFPTPESYKHPNANGLNKHLRLSGIASDFPIIVKREKGAYVYDVDDNKYVDFYLNNGTVIYGHNYGTLTQYIKNGLSVGTGTVFVNKFHYRLLKTLREIVPFETVAFFSGIMPTLNALLEYYRPQKITVTSRYLAEMVGKVTGIPLIPNASIDPAENGKEELSPLLRRGRGRHGDRKEHLLFYEPVDFEGDLSDLNPDDFDADVKIAVENRTGFRFHYGFLSDPQKCDVILSAGNIANGMDVAAVLFREHSELCGELLPIYRTVAVNETLKFYRRKIDYSVTVPKIRSDKILHQRESVFKLKSDVDIEEMLSRGIILRGDTGFISRQHTVHDLRRLERALTLLDRLPHSTGNRD